MTTLIVFAGLPGTGKSYASKIMHKKIQHKRIDCVFFDSDAFAKESNLFKVKEGEKISDQEFAKIRLEFYHSKISKIKDLLGVHNVIMDAAFDKENLRALFYEAVKSINANLIVIEVAVPEQIALNRILKDISTERIGTPESRKDAYLKMKASWERISVPLNMNKLVHYYKLDSDKDIEHKLDVLSVDLIQKKLI